ncbi:helix-turn-helix domain-containing protein [Kitasatospora purpeofusca]|uniref:helix-turn-helix domain-containing protein n=1 Tax=Kitasatospora purpeofusca TaxID=67352 RepID=UPI0038281365
MSAAGEAGLDWAALGRKIRQARVKIGMTQAELAGAAGLDRKSISNYENGRPPARADRVPDGYYKVGEILQWPPGAVEDYLLAGDEARPHPGPAPMPPAAAPLDLYPFVGRFARAAVAAGGDPALRDVLEEVADRLLRSIPQGQPKAVQQSGYGLAAYRPHAWAEGDAGVPDDDAARIEQALEEHSRRRREEP